MTSHLKEAALKDAFERGKDKENIIIMACDDFQKEGVMHNVGVVIGDVKSLSYALVELMEREPYIAALINAAHDVYTKWEKRKNGN